MSECKPTEVDRLAQIIRTADGNHDMGAGALAERDNRVRADERAKLQDRIEELEKNLSYEVEQKIKLADTLRDERAKRSDLPCDGGCNVNGSATGGPTGSAGPGDGAGGRLGGVRERALRVDGVHGGG